MHSESRRNFVKKSLATSVTISFAGLIRAHGQEGGGTTWSPNQSTYSSTNGRGTTTWNPNQGSTTPIQSTTWNPNQGTTYYPNSTTFDPSQTTFDTTIDMTTAAPKKPKQRMFTIQLWVTGYNSEGDAVFSTSAEAAKVHTDLAETSKPEIEGEPAVDGSVGTLKAGGEVFPDQLTQKIDIATDKIHTAIILGGDLNPNPKITYGAVNVPGEQGKYYKKFDVQVSYEWVYP